jgi:methoxymalonate biosynthesis acyl carrier protein
MATIVKHPTIEAPLTPVENTIREFILQDVLYDRELEDLSPEDSLLETELLDSIAIMQIVAFCEQAFDIDIPEEELLPDHFENMRVIGQLVERRLAAKVA